MSITPVLRNAENLNPTNLGQSLHELIQANNMKQLSTAINPINVNQFIDGKTPLHLACKLGRLDAVRILLQNGADPWIPFGDHKGTTLMLAAAYGHVEIIDDLLKHDPELIKATTSSNATALVGAIQNDHIEAFKTLVIHGADPNAPYFNNLHNALSCAACYGKLRMIQYLVTHYPQFINQKNGSGLTPIAIACLSNQSQAAKILVDNGADVTLCDHKGLSLLHHAAEKKYEWVVDLVLQCGKNLDPILNLSVNGKTAFDMAFPQCPNIAAKLYKAGADCSIYTQKFMQQMEHMKAVSLQIKEGSLSNIEAIFRSLDCAPDLMLAMQEKVFVDLAKGYVSQVRSAVDSLLTAPLLNSHVVFLSQLANRNITTVLEESSSCITHLEKLQSLYGFIASPEDKKNLDQLTKSWIERYEGLKCECEATLALLRIKNPMKAFDCTPVLDLLLEPWLGLPTTRGFQNSPLVLKDKLGMEPERIRQAGIVSGAELRNIGITFNLHDLAHQWWGGHQSAAQVVPKINEELNRMERIIREQLPDYDHLLSNIKTIRNKLDQGIQPADDVTRLFRNQIYSLNRIFVIALLKTNIQNNPKRRAVE